VGVFGAQSGQFSAGPFFGLVFGGGGYTEILQSAA